MPAARLRAVVARPNVTLPRPPVRLLAALLALLLVVGGGWLWLRDSSLVRVREVFILGVSSSDEQRIRSALRNAALDMTTLHVREDQLRAAVARFPSVAGLRVQTDFPDELTVEVVEHRPVAAVELDGRRVPVGAGGLVMRGVQADEDLPTVASRPAQAGGRLTDGRALAAVAVLAAAPTVLREKVERTTLSSRGLTLQMRGGPDLVFGSADAVRAKWAAAARVLADPSATGATYLDLRVPERVAAGGLAPVATPDPAAAANPQPLPENTVNLQP